MLGVLYSLHHWVWLGIVLAVVSYQLSVETPGHPERQKLPPFDSYHTNVKRLFLFVGRGFPDAPLCTEMTLKVTAKRTIYQSKP